MGVSTLAHRSIANPSVQTTQRPRFTRRYRTRSFQELSQTLLQYAWFLLPAFLLVLVVLWQSRALSSAGSSIMFMKPDTSSLSPATHQNKIPPTDRLLGGSSDTDSASTQQNHQDDKEESTSTLTTVVAGKDGTDAESGRSNHESDASEKKNNQPATSDIEKQDQQAEHEPSKKEHSSSKETIQSDDQPLSAQGSTEERKNDDNKVHDDIATGVKSEIQEKKFQKHLEGADPTVDKQQNSDKNEQESQESSKMLNTEDKKEEPKQDTKVERSGDNVSTTQGAQSDENTTVNSDEKKSIAEPKSDETMINSAEKQAEAIKPNDQVNNEVITSNSAHNVDEKKEDQPQKVEEPEHAQSDSSKAQDSNTNTTEVTKVYQTSSFGSTESTERNSMTSDVSNATETTTTTETFGKLPDISVVVLFHSEYPTLIHSLDTWEQNGLTKLVSEFVFFLNGIESPTEFHSRIPRLLDPKWFGFGRVITSAKNLPLGLAIRQMVFSAKSDYVLLLEKDWALIEPYEQLHAQLLLSARLLHEEKAHVVRYRHRKRPGAPLYAQITYQGKENKILQRQTNLYCYMHHWIDDLDKEYGDYFKQCGVTTTSESTSHKVWCSKAKYCNWTNNPGMFLRKWFLEALGDPFQKNYNETVQNEPQSGMLDFEFYTNWKSEIWNDRDYTVALPLGLFEHQEIGEQNFQNTIWHAWSRLSGDVNEKQDGYFSIERNECAVEQKTHESGAKYKDNFPLDFVHLYHYDKAMTRTVEEAVVELGEEAVKQKNAIREGHATWRNGITELTNLWHKTVLFSFLPEPVGMKIAFTSAVYVPDEEGQSENDKEKKKNEIAKEAAGNLNQLKQYGMIIFTDTSMKRNIINSLQTDWKWTEEDISSKIAFMNEEVGDLLSRLLGVDAIKRINEIRDTEGWKNKLNNLRAAAFGSAATPSHIPSEVQLGLSLVTPLLLRDAEQKLSGRNGTSPLENMSDNLKQTTHFVWFDSVSKCIQSSSIAPKNDHALRGNLLMNILATGKQVHTRADLEKMLGGDSGFDQDVFLTEAEIRDMSSGLKVADGRTLGGSRLAVTLLAGYYEAVLTDMLLRRGVLGTLREPLTIALRNVEYNFHFVDSFSACPRSTDCDKAVDLADGNTASSESEKGCRLYEWAKKCTADMTSKSATPIDDAAQNAITETESTTRETSSKQREEQKENKPISAESVMRQESSTTIGEAPLRDAPPATEVAAEQAKPESSSTQKEASLKDAKRPIEFATDEVKEDSSTAQGEAPLKDAESATEVAVEQTKLDSSTTQGEASLKDVEQATADEKEEKRR